VSPHFGTEPNWCHSCDYISLQVIYRNFAGLIKITNHLTTMSNLIKAKFSMADSCRGIQGVLKKKYLTQERHSVLEFEEECAIVQWKGFEGHCQS
jgi:hypothetical protein